MKIAAGKRESQGQGKNFCFFCLLPRLKSAAFTLPSLREPGSQPEKKVIGVPPPF